MDRRGHLRCSPNPNRRAAIGIGAGWADLEDRAYGIDFPSAGVRLDQLEEGVAIVRSLLREEVTTFAGGGV